MHRQKAQLLCVPATTSKLFQPPPPRPARPHLRMILDDSVFPAPDSPDTMIDWLAAFLPAPSRIWW